MASLGRFNFCISRHQDAFTIKIIIIPLQPPLFFVSRFLSCFLAAAIVNMIAFVAIWRFLMLILYMQEIMGCIDWGCIAFF